MDPSYPALHSMAGVGASPVSLHSHTSATQSTRSSSPGVSVPPPYPPARGLESHSSLSFMDVMEGNARLNEASTPRSLPTPTTSSNGLPQECRPSATDRTHCICVQKHIELLYQLQSATSDVTVTPADSFLKAARQTLEYWNRLLLCPSCRVDGEQGAWLLSAMSIRLVVRQVMDMQEGKTVASASQSPPLRILVGNFDVTGEDHQAVVNLLLESAVERLKQALGYILRCLNEKGSA